MSTIGIVWLVLGLAAAVGLAVLVRTRWLQSHTLSKCVLLSVVLHAVLAMVAAFIGGMRPASWGLNDEGRMSMTVALSEDPEDADVVVADEPADDAEPVAEESEPVELEPPQLVDLTAAEPAAPADLVPLLEVASEVRDDVSKAENGVTEPTVAEGSGREAAASVTQPPATPSRPAVPEAYADRMG